MFFFNFVGLAFAGMGAVTTAGVWWLLYTLWGDSLQAGAAAVAVGSLLSLALDLRYRIIGELPEEAAGASSPREASESPDTAVARLTDRAKPSEKPSALPPANFWLSLVTIPAGALFRILWPFSGGQILFFPIWMAAASLIGAVAYYALYFMGPGGSP